MAGPKRNNMCYTWSIDINSVLRIDHISKAKKTATISPQSSEEDYFASSDASRNRHTSNDCPAYSTTERKLDLSGYDSSPARENHNVHHHQSGSASGEPVVGTEIELQRVQSKRPAIKLEPENDDAGHSTKRARHEFETPASEAAAVFDTPGFEGALVYASYGLNVVEEVTTELTVVKRSLVSLAETKIEEEKKFRKLARKVQSCEDTIRAVNERLARIEHELRRRS